MSKKDQKPKSSLKVVPAAPARGGNGGGIDFESVRELARIAAEFDLAEVEADGSGHVRVRRGGNGAVEYAPAPSGPRPIAPSRATFTFGTMNSEMPLTPGGASGSRAKTRWMMLSVKSCSPPVMNILVPVIANVPSACGSARVFSKPRSEPQCASVRHIVPVHCPAMIGRRNTSFCQSWP